MDQAANPSRVGFLQPREGLHTCFLWFCLRGGHRHPVTILFDRLGTDTTHKGQILDLFEWPVLLTILNDS